MALNEPQEREGKGITWAECTDTKQTFVHPIPGPTSFDSNLVMPCSEEARKQMPRYESVSDDRALELGRDIIKGLSDAGMDAEEAADFLDILGYGVRLAVEIEKMTILADTEPT